MQTLKRDELAFLAVVGHPLLTKKALRLYAQKAVLFHKTYSPLLYVMWDGYLDCLQTNKPQMGFQISRDIIAAAIAERVAADDTLPEELVQKSDQLLKRLIIGEIPTETEGAELLKYLIQLDSNRKISAQVTMNAGIEELQRTLDSTKRVMGELTPQKTDKARIMYNPLAEMDRLAVRAERVPTGINWMDIASNGGGRAGELWLILGPSGGGKCLAKGTKVVMYDGSTKCAEDVQVGDLLLGPDSTPRRVLELGRGRSKMYKITPVKGDPYVVNDAHILTLSASCGHTNGIVINGVSYKHGDLVDISVQDYLKLCKHKQVILKGIRTCAVEFQPIPEPKIDPYFIGLYLGDGTRRRAQISSPDPEIIDYCRQIAARYNWGISVVPYKHEDCFDVRLSRKTGSGDAGVITQLRTLCINENHDKYIHPVYKYGSIKTRAALLAGLIDTDGYMHHGHYEISTKFDCLAEDILFVARSLGLAAYDNYGRKVCKNTGAAGMYHRITISGDSEFLPIRIERKRAGKRKQVKNVLKTGITVTELPEDDYYGFVIDGDHRFVLGDFTITHNTVTSVQYGCAQALMGNTTLWATYEQSLEGDIAERMIANITDVSLDEIRDKGFTNLPEEVQNKFWAAVAGVSDKLKVLDMTHMQLDSADPADNGGMYTVWKYIKELREQGTPVKTVIIDWVGAMMSVVGAVTGKDLSKGYRFYTQAEIDIARRIVKEENCQIIFFHQSSSVAQHAKPTYIPDKTDAKDMKDMCNYFDLVFTIGNRDKNNICYFNAAKSRKGASTCQTLQLIGEKQRFIIAKGWLPNRDGNFYKPSDDLTDSYDDNTAADKVSSYSREII